MFKLFLKKSTRGGTGPLRKPQAWVRAHQQGDLTCLWARKEAESRKAVQMGQKLSRAGEDRPPMGIIMQGLGSAGAALWLDYDGDYIIIHICQKS